MHSIIIFYVLRYAGTVNFLAAEKNATKEEKSSQCIHEFCFGMEIPVRSTYVHG